jgi:hypothetical protein
MKTPLPAHEERFQTKLLLQNKKLKRNKQIRYFSIAASLVLLITLPLYFFFGSTNPNIAQSPFTEEVQKIIQSYQAKLDTEIEEIKIMGCYAQMKNELAEIQKDILPTNDLAPLPVEKQIYYIKQIYNIKIETVQYLQTFCGGGG